MKEAESKEQKRDIQNGVEDKQLQDTEKPEDASPLPPSQQQDMSEQQQEEQQRSEKEQARQEEEHEEQNEQS